MARLPATFWPKFALETESEITGEAPRVHFSVKLVFPVRPLVALATTGSYAPRLRSPTALIWQFAATEAVALKFLLMAVACAGALARSRTAIVAAARIRTDVRGMTTSSYAVLEVHRGVDGIRVCVADGDVLTRDRGAVHVEVS